MLFLTYIVDPADVVTGPGKHRGLLRVVAAQAGAKANHTLDVPGAVSILTVQRTTGVPLKEENCCGCKASFKGTVTEYFVTL